MTMINDSRRKPDDKEAYYFQLNEEGHRLANYALEFGTKLYEAYLAEEEDYLQLLEEEERVDL